MTIEQLLKILKTDYIEVAHVSDPYGSIEYLRRDEIKDNTDLLSQTVTAIEPLAALKKKLFVSASGDSEYVASVKVLYGGETIEVEDEEVVYSQPYEEEVKEERSNPFFGGFGPMNGMPTMDIEQMRAIVNSDAFKNFMESGIMDTLLPHGMPNFGSGFDGGIDLKDILDSLNPDDDDLD